MNQEKHYRCQTQSLKHLSEKEYFALRELTRLAKNMYNVGLYNIRQHYFATGEYLSYEKNYHVSKVNENYHWLNTNVAQQILRTVDSSFKSFFALNKLAKEKQYAFKTVKLPQYLEKDSYFPLIIRQIRIQENRFDVPMSPQFERTLGKVSICIPSNLVGKRIKEIRIMPKSYARFFEIQYIYEEVLELKQLNAQHLLAMDLGVNNLATCVTNDGRSFIIDGKRLKTVNQWYNKENARLQSIKDKQKMVGLTKRQTFLLRKRNRQVQDYLNKSARKIINYCLNHDVGTLVVGHNSDFQRHSEMGRRNNQQFVNIPFGKFIYKLKTLSERYGIHFVEQEESYTSKASFFDNDEIPTYIKGSVEKYRFSGKRITRGQYKSAQGIILNADVNGALNIMRKSNLVDLTVLQGRGGLDTPKRIKVA